MESGDNGYKVGARNQRRPRPEREEGEEEEGVEWSSRHVGGQVKKTDDFS